MSSTCTNPIVVDRWGRPYTSNGQYGWKPGDQAPMGVTIHARCRQCPECRRHRTALWTARAIAEIQETWRTWFVTLTFNQEWRTKSLELARHQAQRNGYDFETLSAEEQSLGRFTILGAEVTKFLKRLRKKTAGNEALGIPAMPAKRLRYLAVPEDTENNPHYHLLVHQVDEHPPLLWAEFKYHWHLWGYGFHKSKLVEDEKKAAFYTCKYITKDIIGSRLRASSHYGNQVTALGNSEHRET